jgi:AraC-like DNA-binding protein
MNIWIVFYGAATINGIFLSIILCFIDKGNKKANKILASLIFLLTLYILDNFLGRLGFFELHPHYLYIVVPLWYLFAPLTYFYFRYLTDQKVKWDSVFLLHLIPFLLVLYRILPFYFLPGNIKLQYFTGTIKPQGTELIRLFYTLLGPLQITAYSLYIFKKLFNQRTIDTVHTALVSWLKLFTSLLITYGICTAILLVIYIVTGTSLILIKNLPLAVFTILIFSIGYISIVNPEKLFSINIKSAKRDSHYDQILLKQLSVKVNDLMKTEKPYLNCKLKYSEIASRLKISTRLLTNVLNTEIGKTFNDYINEYRVREVVERLSSKQNDKYTLLSIALDCGFNSKSSFNRIFKKHTGLTPTGFISAFEKEKMQKVS